MKLRKRLLSAVLSLCMVAGLLPATLHAEAADTKTGLYAAASAVTVGTGFTVEFKQPEEMEEVTNYDVAFGFDTAKLEVTSVKPAVLEDAKYSFTSFKNANKTGQAYTFGTASKNAGEKFTLPAKADLLTVTFKVKEGVEVGTTTDITLNKYSVYGLDANKRPIVKTPSDDKVGAKKLTITVAQNIGDSLKVEFTNKKMPYGDRYGKVPETKVTATVNGKQVELTEGTDYTVEGAGNYKYNGGWPYVAGQNATVKISPAAGSQYSFTAKEYSFTTESNEDALTIAYKDGKSLSKAYDGKPVEIEYNEDAVLSQSNDDPLKIMTMTSTRATKGGQFVYTDGSGYANKIVWTFYTDAACTTQTDADNNGAASEGAAPSKPGEYWLKASLAADNAKIWTAAESNALKFEIKDTYGVLSVEAKIDAIGTVTLESEAAIKEARDAYDALPDEAKQYVKNTKTLTDAEEALKALKEADEKAVADVISKIGSIGTVTLDSEQAITDARTAYDKLTDAQKKRVSNYPTLTEAEAALKELWKNDNVTCWVRAEGDDGTVMPWTKVTMNKHDIPSFSDYGVKNAPDDVEYISALHIMLQGLKDRGLTDELATVDIGSSGWIQDIFGWGADNLWCIRGIDAPKMSRNYPAEDGDMYTFYEAHGNWGAGYGYTAYGFFGEFGEGQDYTPKSAIEQIEQTVEVGEAADFKYLYTSSMHYPDQYGPCNNENGYTTKVYVSADGKETTTEEDYRDDIQVDKDGKFQVTFDKPGTYIVGARYYNPDGSVGACKAYCKVTVKDTYGVVSVMEKIDAIGTVTTDSEAAIKAARSAYDALPDEAKSKITNYPTLVKAEKKLAEVKKAAADKAAADAVEKKIDAIGTVTLEKEDAIKDARKSYDALTEDQKKLVDNVDKLIEAEETLKTLICEVEVTPTDAKAAVASGMSADKKALAEKTALVLSDSAKTALKESVADVQKNFRDMTFVKKELKKKGYEVSANDTVKVMVKPYLSMNVKDVVAEGDDKSVSVEISMLYDVEVLVNGTAVKLVEGGIVAAQNCKTMDITLQIANSIFSESEVKEHNGIYVEHKKADGTVYKHDAVLKDGTGTNPDEVTFTNDKGYSLFTVKLNAKTDSNSSSGHHSGSSGSSSSQQTGSPKTGDTANIWLPLCLLIVAGAGICVVMKKRKKED